MSDFAKQFIGPWAWRILLGAIIFHFLAFFVRETSFELPLLIIIGLATFIIAYKSLPNGLLIAFAELFIGGHGHLFDATIFGFSVSLRIVVFAAVMLAWLVLWLKKEVRPNFFIWRDLPWLSIALAVFLGSVIGFLRNSASIVFDDMNGYLTIAYLLPIISIEWTQTLRRNLLQVLFGAATWLAGFTLLLSYLFTHLDGKTLHVLYAFVRDSRLAEITIQVISGESSGLINTLGLYILGDGGYFYRVFMQSQFFLLAGFVLLSSAMFLIWRGQKMPGLAWGSLILFFAGILLSMSRSFFLGLAAAALIIFVASFLHGKMPILNAVKRSLAAIVVTAFALGLAILTVAVPLPKQPDITEAAFYSTSEDNSRDLAVSSRWSLLGPMMEEIYKRPILGSGFGTEITYVTDDPRIRDLIPDGILTTYRFEWGYQDLWLKMGIFGLLAFAFYAVVIVFGVRATMMRHGHAWIVFGLGAGILALYVTHIFSPYLNHPIGLGFMLFILPFIDWQLLNKKANFEKLEFIKNGLIKQKIANQTSPVATSNNSGVN